MARLLEREITVLSILSSEACCFRAGKKMPKKNLPTSWNRIPPYRAFTVNYGRTKQA